MSNWLRNLARDMKRWDTALGMVADVELERQSSTVSGVTGERGFLPRVAAKAKIFAREERKFAQGADQAIEDPRFDLLLYDAMVETGDRIWWDSEYHIVLSVRGIVDAGNALRCTTN